ncbi:GlxA family transcriptional regulator [Actinoplanes sp. CA-142083]|uniref:GlxA family transcriptional regulator n=1 Tax=Actinoplanes sp. CA-142083 TaxID=3239903 RepID=UPI003D9446D7
MRNVAVLTTSTVLPFELAVYCEVFGIDRTHRGVPAFDFAICSEHPGVPVPIPGGLHVTPTEGLERLAAADLVAVAPPISPTREVSPAVAEALHAAAARGARVVPVSAAGIELCLRLIREDHGSVVAEAVTCGMVLGPRPARPAPPPLRRPDDGIDKLLDWALGNLHEDLSIDVLARRAFLSTRSFARRFRAATGTTPYAWILEQRVRLAQQLLETDPRVGVEEAAGRAGFSSAALLRQHFQRRFGCSPSEYRARFATTSPG